MCTCLAVQAFDLVPLEGQALQLAPLQPKGLLFGEALGSGVKGWRLQGAREGAQAWAGTWRLRRAEKQTALAWLNRGGGRHPPTLALARLMRRWLHPVSSARVAADTKQWRGGRPCASRTLSVVCTARAWGMGREGAGAVGAASGRSSRSRE